MKHIMKKPIFLLVLLWIYLPLPAMVVAGQPVVSRLTITDVGTTSFSVVWISSEPSTCTLLVFDEQRELKTGVSIEPDSKEYPPAEELGVMKVSVSGPEIFPNTTYYVQTVTTSKADNQVTIYPQDPISVRTQKTAFPTNNFVLLQDIYFEDGEYGDGSLMIVSVEGSNYPVSGWVGEYPNPSSPWAPVDLNNVYSRLTREALEINGGEIMIIEVFGGVRGYAHSVREVPPPSVGIPFVQLSPPIILNNVSIITGLGSYPLHGGWIQAFAEDYSLRDWLHIGWPAYNSLNGETRITTGDIDGDKKDEIVIGFGPVSGNESIPGGWFQVLDDDYSSLAWGRTQRSAYNSANGETWPACGDVDGDGKDEIVIGLGSYPADGGFFEVFAYESGTLTFQASKHVQWAAYNSANGETRPACGDVDGDGKDEIIIGLGQGGGGWLEVFDDAASGYAHLAWPRVAWDGYNSANGETRPAGGDVDDDGKDEIIIGLGQGGGGWLEVFDDTASGYGHLEWLQVNWPAYNSSNGETWPTAIEK
jgi:hypothetical protein